MNQETKIIIFYVLLAVNIGFLAFIFITRYLDRHNDHHHHDDEESDSAQNP